MRNHNHFATGLVSAFLLTTLSLPVQALPEHAMKYKVLCSQCHMAPPVLNDTGRAFRETGQLLIVEPDPGSGKTGGEKTVAGGAGDSKD